MNAAGNWQLWNQLQAAELQLLLRAAGQLQREINRVLDLCGDSLECREWATLRRTLRPIAPAIASTQLLDHLLLAEAFIRGFEGDDTQEGIDVLLAGIRAAIGAAKLAVQGAQTQAAQA
jgi:hypothetical protein